MEDVRKPARFRVEISEAVKDAGDIPCERGWERRRCSNLSTLQLN